MRKRFGQVLNEAAAGERIVIERAGQPIAALVPLSDLAQLDPATRRVERLRAVEDIRRMAQRRPYPAGTDAAAVIREQREARDAQIARATESARRPHPE